MYIQSIIFIIICLLDNGDARSIGMNDADNRQQHAFMFDLQQGYVKDAFNVYFMGKKIEGARPHSFEIIEDGYAKDPWNVYYMGQKIKDATPTSFIYLGDGYGKDAWFTYYRGKKIGGNMN